MNLVMKTILIYSIVGLIVLGAVLTFALCYNPVSLDNCVLLNDRVVDSEYIGRPGATYYTLEAHPDFRVYSLVKLERYQQISFYIPKSQYEQIRTSLQGGECNAVQIEVDGLMLYSVEDYNSQIIKDRAYIVIIFAVIVIIVGPLIILSYLKTFGASKIARKENQQKDRK